MISETQTDQTLMEKYKAQIDAMPDGAAKDAAMAAFVRDYEGELGAANRRQDIGYEMSQAGQPQGMRVGGTYVAANPLEHAAAGLRSYMGYRDMKKARKTQSELSEEKQRIMSAVLRSKGSPSTPTGMTTQMGAGNYRGYPPF